MKTPFEAIAACKLVPVIILQSAAHAGPLGDALVAGGLPCAEVTFRTDAAAASIKTLATRGDMLVGAGTVLRIDQVKQAVDNGASFMVSPGFQPKIVAYCVENGITIVPGISSPSDLCQALEFDLRVFKFFPAEAAGGLEALKAISSPFASHLRFVPTGGITEEKLGRYLAWPKTLACGGSWMVPDPLIAAGKFDEVTVLVRQAVAAAAAAASPGAKAQT